MKVQRMNESLFIVLAVAACGGSSTPAALPAPPSPVAPARQPGPQSVPSPAPEPDLVSTPLPPRAPDPAEVKATLLATELAAFETAKPVFDRYCGSCHTQRPKAKKTTLGHFDMTTYPFGGHHATEISKEIREVLAVDGGKPTMPRGKPGIVKGRELALIAAWADAFDAAHAGGAHAAMLEHGHAHGHEQAPSLAPEATGPKAARPGHRDAHAH